MMHASEVYPFLYIGNLGSRNRDFLRDKNITVIINASNANHTSVSNDACEIEEIVIRQRDTDEADIKKYFDSTSLKIYETEKNNGAVLVHCLAGISRSASLVLAFLMKYKKMTLREAHEFLKLKRRIIRPNNGFWIQLIEYERQLFGKNSVEMVSCPAVQPHQRSVNDVTIPDVYKDKHRNMVMVPDFKKLALFKS